MTSPDSIVFLDSYLTPKVTFGTILTCEARDVDLVVSGYSSGRIPWPVGHLRTGGRNSLIVFGDLADAIRRESVQAICHWFGPAPNVVWKWRVALGVGLDNPGTHMLRSRKIAEVKRGKKRPEHVVEAMIQGRQVKGVSDETRRKMSASHKARGTMPPAAGKPWTAPEDELVRTCPPVEVVTKTGHPLNAVYERRKRLGLPDGRRRKAREQ